MGGRVRRRLSDSYLKRNEIRAVQYHSFFTLYMAKNIGRKLFLIMPVTLFQKLLVYSVFSQMTILNGEINPLHFSLFKILNKLSNIMLSTFTHSTVWQLSR